MRSVFLLTLRQLSGKWRLTILFVLASLPIVIAALLVSFPGAPSVEEFEDGILREALVGLEVGLGESPNRHDRPSDEG